VIDVDQLTRRFGARTAVDSLTFKVPRGQIVGFLGPNGAGKSTTLKMLAGFLPPTSGTARIGGCDIVEASLEARRLIGYMPESFPVYPEMRVDEYLRFRAELKGVSDRKKAVARAMELADITDVSRRLVGELSKGYKQRVGLADAVVSSAPLLILDEPTEGLDPNQILRFREVIRALGKDHTIFLSTHILSEVEAVCSHVVIIHNGRIAATGPLDVVRAELKDATRAVSFVLSVKGALLDAFREDPTAALSKAFAGDEGVEVESVALDGDLARVELRVPSGARGGEGVEAVVAKAVTAGLGVREVTPKVHSLENVFHELTTRAAPAPEAPSTAPTKDAA
jgi:ABC-2 type transport system ATP-binding protein